jgi:hypothetical protein
VLVAAGAAVVVSCWLPAAASAATPTATGSPAPSQCSGLLAQPAEGSPQLAATIVTNPPPTDNGDGTLTWTVALRPESSGRLSTVLCAYAGSDPSVVATQATWGFGPEAVQFTDDQSEIPFGSASLTIPRYTSFCVVAAVQERPDQSDSYTTTSPLCASPPSTPLATIASFTGPSDLTDHAATFQAQVNPNDDVVDVSVSTKDVTTGQEGPGSNDVYLGPNVDSDQDVTLAVTGLTPGDSYTATVSADDRLGSNATVTSQPISFTALSGPAPTQVVTNGPSQVFSDLAYVSGSWYAPGSDTVTFEWGTTDQYGQTVAANDVSYWSDGAQISTADGTLTPLQPHTTYHYRIVVDDGHHDPVYGQDESFTTPDTGGELPVGGVGAAGMAAVAGGILFWRMKRRARTSR